MLFEPVSLPHVGSVMRKFILVEVPIEATEFSINNVGCLRYSYNQGRESTAIEPPQIGHYLEKEKHQIVGEVIGENKRTIVIEIEDIKKASEILEIPEPLKPEEAILTIKQVNVIGKWAEFWFEEDFLRKGVEYQLSSKASCLWDAVNRAELDVEIMNNGFVGKKLKWKKIDGINWDIEDFIKEKSSGIGETLKKGILGAVKLSCDGTFNNNLDNWTIADTPKELISRINLTIDRYFASENVEGEKV
jgi:hypothetical protein